MRNSLRITTESTLRRITNYAKKAPQGMENLSYSTLIRMIRKKLFMTQTQLAKKAGVPQSHIANIEKGNMHPRVDTLEKIFKALYCNLLMVPKPEQDLDYIISHKIDEVSKKKMNGVLGTMRLEDQSPKKSIAQEMLREEKFKLKNHTTSKIWEE